MKTPLARILRAVAGLLIAVITASICPTVADAAGWSTTLAAGSRGEATAGAVPATPTGVAATCVSASGQTIKVSWTAVAHATTYSVYASTTTVGGTYNSVATGVTAVNWTSGTLTAGSYWYKVVASAGTNWSSAKSTNSAQRTIASGSCT